MPCLEDKISLKLWLTIHQPSLRFARSDRALCNVSPSPGYTLPEFCLAMHLAEQAARNPDSDQIPTLDDTIIREVQIASGYTPPEPKPTTGHSPNSSARPPVVMPEPGAARPLRPEVQTGRAKDAENPFRAMMRSGESPNVQTVVDVVEQGPISAEGLRKADDLFGALKGEDGYMDGGVHSMGGRTSCPSRRMLTLARPPL